MPKGFTLVELVTVIAVMSVMAAIAAPRFIGADTFNARGNLGLVVSSLRYAQKTAIAQHRTVYVQVNTVSKTISLCYTSNCDTLLQDPASSGNYRLNFNSDVTVIPSQTTLGFTSEGVPTPNADATYIVTNSKNTTQTSTVKVEAGTGYVRKL